jgi:hypothetical protein
MEYITWQKNKEDDVAPSLQSTVAKNRLGFVKGKDFCLIIVQDKKRGGSLET